MQAVQLRQQVSVDLEDVHTNADLCDFADFDTKSLSLVFVSSFCGLPI